ncbi:BZ3500_MvSof-1268-A1-R1_Chr1-3g01917 [Microbotryum saponariae]|uniref:BZ3500_MvSof-1268-A1-R1_Chr1-3g01917 protein n=1 Tax=Microbotryum saponariae TaxID=289078 RepID=A0A2X0MEM2_9BASI|nr:BZ3500_MvSof-1268-A1-R1_Chr1-3g01917 [Microbotryum saponariae]SCZ94894.1 BZ3501_MvSof-1269-A2-R1_Chr1-3g01519 [Microbotryum saponariae]
MALWTKLMFILLTQLARRMTYDRRHHVPRYHEWMSDPAVREATASEPLTLEEEFAMQEMTFIVLAQTEPTPLDASATIDQLRNHDASDAMIGDVNVFLSTMYPSDDEEGADLESSSNPRARERHPLPTGRRQCEVEIMIPMASNQRKGYAFEALRIFLPYVSHVLGIPPNNFFARIGATNSASLDLFEHKLGFERGSTSVFDEVEMTCSHDEWNFPKVPTASLEYPATPSSLLSHHAHHG